LTEAEMTARGITCLDVDRGGDVTYHGPGQLVGYPILDLGPKPDVGLYLRNLESCLIDVLADFGIMAGRLSGYTGVWIGDRKIAAIGIKVSQGVTTHGFALNVSTDLSLFTHILACGIPNKGVTSIALELGAAPAMAAVEEAVIARFSERFVLPGTPAAHVA
jgi:lipoyl(octanoyl) transferase